MDRPRSSLALPVATLRRIVAILLRHGRVRRGMLGISAYPALLPDDVHLAEGQRGGLLVLSVEPDTRAARCAVQVGGGRGGGATGSSL